MNPGLLNRRLTLQSRALSADAVGGRVETWSDVGQIWAQEISQSQREQIVADAERNTDSRQFRIRWRNGLTSEGFRIVYQGRKYDITGVSEEGVKKMMRITCEASRNLEL